ncbi:ABC transporter permease [candidate division KSB1 bacterium]
MPENAIKTPRLGRWLLFRMLDKSARYDILGDFEEEYKAKKASSGSSKAWIWYWGQVFRSVPAFIFNSAAWNLIMLNNYMKTSVRNMKTHKGYSIINITGLAVGMACSLVLLLWVMHDLSFDIFHENSHRIYRLVVEIENDRIYDQTARVPSNLGPALQKRYPEVLKFVRYIDRENFVPVKYGNKTHTGYTTLNADSTFLDIFSFPLYRGNPETALSGIDPVLITESMSMDIFGDLDCIGKILKIEDRECTVTGILKDIPSNSHLQFDCLLKFRSPAENIAVESWYSTVYGTYVIVEDNTTITELEKRISGDNELYRSVNSQQLSLLPVKMTGKITLQPLKDIYLHSDNFRYDRAVTGEIRDIYILASLAILIMTVTCINFMNLAALRSFVRAKEVGMRKVIGARRKNLVRQFFSESVLVFLIAMIFALVFVSLTVPVLNGFTGKKLSLVLLFNGNNVFMLAGIVFLTAFISGYYPALFLSSFKPLKLLKKAMDTGFKGSLFIRRTLVVFQFSISAVLILSSVVIYRQLDFVRAKNLGFDKENLLIVGIISDYIRDIDPVIDKLLESPDIINVAIGPRPIYHQIGNTTNIQLEGSAIGEDTEFQCYNIDHNYIDTYKMELVAGRNFSGISESAVTDYILNEEAVRILDLRSPVGRNISIDGRSGKIIGVVKNFHHSSLHNLIQPVVFRLGDSKAVNVRYAADRKSEAIGYIKAVFTDAVPDYPYDHIFLDETLNEFYFAEDRIGTVLNYVSLITILIAGLGLYGLASFSAERRTKEIGIRKVLGASFIRLVRLLTLEFTVLVFIANIIAVPVAWYLMSYWLQDFAYRIELDLGLLIITGMAVMFITIASASLQVFKAARTNPVKSIKYE